MTNIERIMDMEQRMNCDDGVKHRMIDFVVTDLG